MSERAQEVQLAVLERTADGPAIGSVMADLVADGYGPHEVSRAIVRLLSQKRLRLTQDRRLV